MDINGSQMTVCWHVDDLKVSHKDSFEVTKFSTYLAAIYGNKMTRTQGPVHEYLGMDLDLSEKGNAKISMIKYICRVLKEFPEEITGSVPTPYTDNLFMVRDDKDATYLSKERWTHINHLPSNKICHVLSPRIRTRRTLHHSKRKFSNTTNAD